MKLKLFFSFLLIALSMTTFAQNKAKTYLDQENLKGKVKNVKYLSNEGNLDRELIFDTCGNILMDMYYYDDTTYGTWQKSIYKYNKKGILISRYFYAAEVVQSKTIYNYNKKGLLISQDLYYKDEEEGDNVFEKTKGKGENCDSSFNKCIKEHIYYKYDKNGDVIEEKMTDLEGFTAYISYKYNEQRQIKEQEVNYMSNPFQTVFEYDDDYGDLLKSIVTSDDEQYITHYFYQYDLHNNWIYSKAIRTNNYDDSYVEVVIQRREIEYYE
jgi:hypothetical protein